MSDMSWKELFPSKLSFLIFVVYILLFVNQGNTLVFNRFFKISNAFSGILVTASQKSDNQYEYNIVTVVLLTEVLKLVISSLLYCRE